MQCQCGNNSWKIDYDSEYHIFICYCLNCGFCTTIYEDPDNYLDMEK